MPRASAVVDPRIGDFGPALLALEDGAIFPGVAFGASVAAGGDLVVNTSQTGYQEVCTDPSYAGQVVVMTYPLIGNYGRLADDDQSIQPWLRALVVANATAAVLSDARQLAALLRDNAIPAIAGVDTRALARHLRANGSLRGIVSAPGETDPDAAIVAARAVARWEDQDFVSQVSPPAVTDYPAPDGAHGPRIAIVDLGLKNNIVRAMRYPRGERPRPAAHRHGLGGPVVRHRRCHPVAGTGRSGAAGGPGGARPRGHRCPTAPPRDLPRASDRGTCGRCRHDAPWLRASRCEPPRRATWSWGSSR